MIFVIFQGINLAQDSKVDSKKANFESKKVSDSAKKNTSKKDSKTNSKNANLESNNIKDSITLKEIPIPNLKTDKVAKEKLYPHITMQFGLNKKKKNKVLKSVISSKISSPLFNDSKDICKDLFMSALQDLQNQALQLKASKILNIISNEKKPQNAKTFSCDVGKMFSKVTLKADIVK